MVGPISGKFGCRTPNIVCLKVLSSSIVVDVVRGVVVVNSIEAVVVAVVESVMKVIMMAKSARRQLAAIYKYLVSVLI